MVRYLEFSYETNRLSRLGPAIYWLDSDTCLILKKFSKCLDQTTWIGFEIFVWYLVWHSQVRFRLKSQRWLQFKRKGSSFSTRGWRTSAENNKVLNFLLFWRQVTEIFEGQYLEGLRSDWRMVFFYEFKTQMFFYFNFIFLYLLIWTNFFVWDLDDNPVWAYVLSICWGLRWTSTFLHIIVYWLCLIILAKVLNLWDYIEIYGWCLIRQQ